MTMLSGKLHSFRTSTVSYLTPVDLRVKLDLQFYFSKLNVEVKLFFSVLQLFQKLKKSAISVRPFSHMLTQIYCKFCQINEPDCDYTIIRHCVNKRVFPKLPEIQS